MLAVDSVVDALAVDVPQDAGASRLFLFVVLRDGARLDEAFAAERSRRIREDCSPRHAPDEIEQVAEIPRTLSGRFSRFR